MQVDDQIIRAGAVAAAVLAIVGALALLRRGVRLVTRTLRMLREFLEDWNGEPARTGVPGRMGVMARLERIEARLPLDPSQSPTVTVNVEGHPR